MERRVVECDGRLVYVIEQVDMSTFSQKRYVDGKWQVFLDGEEVTPVEAEAFRLLWEADKKSNE